jgi:hypothetical protein
MATTTCEPSQIQGEAVFKSEAFSEGNEKILLIFSSACNGEVVQVKYESGEILYQHFLSVPRPVRPATVDLRPDNRRQVCLGVPFVGQLNSLQHLPYDAHESSCHLDPFSGRGLPLHARRGRNRRIPPACSYPFVLSVKERSNCMELFHDIVTHGENR